MPAGESDRRLLARCALAIVGGLALMAVGAVIDPPLWVLRRLAG